MPEHYILDVYLTEMKCTCGNSSLHSLSVFLSMLLTFTDQLKISNEHWNFS